ncbi:hypothetical protein GCM10008106_33900 [Mongoliitalea lutea]|uniref:DUF2237 domain-containing protein n=2 Tax=Mongoliitalea lutea TaxID=849756 RepID=A0A8J3G798_9BACT|nr:hypothetical protein GCM10008106_33900 [Mongoliitalea lutea]
MYSMALNVFGEPLIVCSTAPLTGYYRNGCCETGEEDLGTHTVCAIMTDDFLQFSLSRGNDLITPRPEWAFPGLKAGDRWCLCASRWMEAYRVGLAPEVVLEATHEKTLTYITLEELVKYSYRQ